MSKTEPAESFAQKTVASLADGTFVRLVLSKPVSTESPQKIFGRAVKLRGALFLSLTLRHPTRDVTQNLAITEVSAWLGEQLGNIYRSALLGTTTRDWQFISKPTPGPSQEGSIAERTRKESGSARLIDHPPSAKRAPTRDHDQKHRSLLDASAQDWLSGLEILDREGKLRASMADKQRQINHYLEIISHLARECGWAGAPNTGSARTAAANPPNRSSALHLVDMGCGKGYLTFGLWHLFARVWKRPIHVTGVEARVDLVATTNRLAKRMNAEGLEFITGEIASAKLPPLDALIALHACNTATDDAIKRGIELGAKLIVVAPCCHKEIRPQLGKPAPFAPVLQHGLMEERLAEWTTDGLRALFLEWAGYRTKIMEFVGGEHTPKNLMIAAVRERDAFMDEEARKRILELKSFLSIEHHALDTLLKHTL